MARTKATSQDTTIQTLLEVVQQKRAEIQSAENPVRKTNMTFKFDPLSTQSISLNVEQKVSVLINILAFLLSREAEFNRAAQMLGVSGETFKWCGFTLEDWHHDIQARVTKLDIKQRKAELAELEERLSKLISPELRTRMEIESISKQLGVVTT